MIQFKFNFYQKYTPVYKRYIDSVKSFQIEDDKEGLEFFLNDKVCEHVRQKLFAKGLQQDGLIVAVAAGASFPTKRWLPEYFARVIQSISHSTPVQFVLFGDKNDRKNTDYIESLVEFPVINIAGEFGLMETACALSFADLVLTNDTGLLHLSMALKKKTVAIFGPTTRELGFYPVGENVRVLENNALDCRPCTHIGTNKCPKKHFKCMTEITPDVVIGVLQDILNRV